MFLDGSAGALFAVYYPPLAGAARAPQLLHVPAFAEEMNKSRRMVSLQARALARAGIGVLVVDPYGTGDSAGDFADARWRQWKQDLVMAFHWLSSRGDGPLGLWGHRLGCILACELLPLLPGLQGPLVLWQPVSNGRLFLTQFLRLRVAAAMMGRGETGSTGALMDELRNDRPVEIAGYELAPELALSIESGALSLPAGSDGPRIAWMEVSAPRAGSSPGLSVASRRTVQSLSAAGASVDTVTVAGEPFWTTQEIAVVPSLLEATTRWVSRRETWAVLERAGERP